jgi:hypothetical protein
MPRRLLLPSSDNRIESIWISMPYGIFLLRRDCRSKEKFSKMPIIVLLSLRNKFLSRIYK